jgi:hypothetical protein
MWDWLAWLLAVLVAAWMVYLVAISVGEGTGLGFLLGYIGGMFLLAMLVRFIYSRIRHRPFWSPWIVVVAGVLLLLVRLANVGQD